MAQRWPSTEREFVLRFPDHARNTLHDLSPELKSASGSSWSANHLQACRVVVKDYNGGLPILEPFIVSATDFPSLASLKEISRDDLRILPHRELRHAIPFGSFFVALADVARERSYDLPHRLLRQNIRAPEHPEFRSGEGEGFSSSPVVGSSPYTVVSTYSPGQQNEAPDFEEQIDRKKHEIVSANMAAQFISTILDLYSNQPAENTSTEFSSAPTTFNLRTFQLNCICQDDGSIWRRKFSPVTRTWINLQSKLLCSLEAKSSYSRCDNLGVGTVSDEVNGQQFCELLGSVLSETEDAEYEALEDIQRCRFLISVHQSDITIVYCEFSTEYLSYIYTEQRPQKLPYVTLQRSRKYDVCDPNEREMAAEAIIALTKYFDHYI